MKHISIDCPDDLLVALGATREQFEQEARLAMAAKLYELGRLSSGRAAAMAGMPRVAFLLALHQVGVAVLDLDEDELGHDLRYAQGA